MDDKLIRLLIGWSLPAPLCLCIIYKFFCCIRDLLALLRSQDEPFKPVECVVVDYGEDSTAPLKGYNVSVKRLDGVISRELIPYNYYLDYPRETVKEYIGRHMTFYAKDSAPRHLFCEKDIVRCDIDDEIYTVEWDEEDAQFVLSQEGFIESFSNISNRSCEVLGNVFDNPEYLNRTPESD